GPIRMREALIWSRNLASIRLLRQMGIKYAIDYATRFGFPREDMPQNLTLALGTLGVTPLELASAYATFANGGFRIEPYFIDKIVDHNGEVVWQATPRIASAQCESPAGTNGAQPPGAGAGLQLTSAPQGTAQPASQPGGSGSSAAASPVILPQGATPAATLAAVDALRGGPCDLPASQLAPRAISPQNDWLMTDMLADVIKHGTGQRALVLHRSDLSGKTGTTNDSRDAWFNGYTPDLVTSVWVGYDQERSLGETEEGARTALPIWVDFMHHALQDVPERSRPMPSGLVTLRISPETGVLASAENPNAILETFMINHLPTAAATTLDPSQPTQGGSTTGSDSLF